MMQKLKLVISIIFLVFMFLPLSQCSSVEEAAPSPDGTVATEPSESEKFIPIQQFNVDPASGLFIVGTFVAPLVTCFIRPKKFKFQIVGGLLQAGASVWFIYSVGNWVYGFERTPLIAGHVLMALAILFLILSLITLVAVARSRSGARHSMPDNPS